MLNVGPPRSGCPCKHKTMGFLLLTNLLPVDKFWKNVPLYIRESIAYFKLYVDDFVLAFTIDTSSNNNNNNNITNDLIKMRIEGASLKFADRIKQGGGNVAAGKTKVDARNGKTENDIACDLNVCSCSAKGGDDCNCETNHKIVSMKTVTKSWSRSCGGKPCRPYSK